MSFLQLYTFEANHQRRIGAELRGQLVNLPVAYAALQMRKGEAANPLRALPSEMLTFIRLGQSGLTAAWETLEFMKKRPAAPVGEQLIYPFEAVTLLPPLFRPGKMICVEAAALSMEKLTLDILEPLVWFKTPNSINAAGQPVETPKTAGQLRCSARICAIIGERIKSEPPEALEGKLFGFTAMLDFGLQERSRNLGSNHDTFSPLGPCIRQGECPDENLRFEVTLNGKTISTALGGLWPRRMQAITSILSEVMTLEPGDLVCVAAFAEFISITPGDEVKFEVHGIGSLETRVTEKQ